MTNEWKSYDWYRTETCPNFLMDLDSCLETNKSTLPIKLDVPALSLHHLFWCVENCEGKFHRCRIDGRPDRERENPNGINWSHALGIMAFEKQDDAIIFRLRWGMEDV